MKLTEFKKKMNKNVFTIGEARIVAFKTDYCTLKLQLHSWAKKGDLKRIKKGVYAFAETKASDAEIAKHLYSPCYISMESALNIYGIIPDIPFALTLVTTKATRKFNTPSGVFIYQKIKKTAFLGFNPETLIAEKEKALVDFLYLNKHRFIAANKFWKELRLDNLDQISFRKVFKFAKLFNSKKLIILLESLRKYAKSI